jgi:hypothetical protein
MLVIRVSLEVRNGGTRFTLEVQAENIKQAVNLAITRHPGCAARVLFPIDPEAFFAGEDDSASGTILLEAGEPGILAEPQRWSGLQLYEGLSSPPEEF